jgi:hypothetical protein
VNCPVGLLLLRSWPGLATEESSLAVDALPLIAGGAQALRGVESTAA